MPRNTPRKKATQKKVVKKPKEPKSDLIHNLDTFLKDAIASKALIENAIEAKKTQLDSMDTYNDDCELISQDDVENRVRVIEDEVLALNEILDHINRKLESLTKNKEQAIQKGEETDPDMFVKALAANIEDKKVGEIRHVELPTEDETAQGKEEIQRMHDEMKATTVEINKLIEEANQLNLERNNNIVIQLLLERKEQITEDAKRTIQSLEQEEYSIEDLTQKFMINQENYSRINKIYRKLWDIDSTSYEVGMAIDTCQYTTSPIENSIFTLLAQLISESILTKNGTSPDYYAQNTLLKNMKEIQQAHLTQLMNRDSIDPHIFVIYNPISRAIWAPNILTFSAKSELNKPCLLQIKQLLIRIIETLRMNGCFASSVDFHSLIEHLVEKNIESPRDYDGYYRERDTETLELYLTQKELELITQIVNYLPKDWIDFSHKINTYNYKLMELLHQDLNQVLTESRSPQVLEEQEEQSYRRMLEAQVTEIDRAIETSKEQLGICVLCYNCIAMHAFMHTRDDGTEQECGSGLICSTCFEEASTKTYIENHPGKCICRAPTIGLFQR